MAKPPPSPVDNVVSLAKRRGFVYPCGEIYGGTKSAWDYGPLGDVLERVERGHDLWLAAVVLGCTTGHRTKSQHECQRGGQDASRVHENDSQLQ